MENVSVVTDEKLQPRVAHYLFAHRAVPRSFLRNPPATMGILGSEQAMEFLTGMWQVMDDALAPEDRVEDRTIELECFALQQDIFVAVVTMPPVKRPLEAFFVACAARLGEPAFARAFTLNAASDPTDDFATGLLEWDAEGERTVLEAHCPPERSALVDTLEAILLADHPIE